MTKVCCSSWKSSVSKKVYMSITGLLLSLFVIGHLIGNTLMYLGPESFNKYGHTLMSNPFIYVIEGVLLLIFLTHVITAIKLIIENYMARPEKYYMKIRTGRGATFASATMLYTGPAILIFIIVHLINFKFGPIYFDTYAGIEMRDLHRLMIEFYQSKASITFYIIFMIILGVHISHGFWSLFQSLGINFEPYNGHIKFLAKAFAIISTLGFSAFPLWALLQGGY